MDAVGDDVEPPAFEQPGLWRRISDERLTYQILSILVFLFLWELGARFLFGNFIPSVAEVAAFIVDIVVTGLFFEHAAVTIRRVAVGFLAAYSISVVLGVLMGLYSKAEYFFEVLVLIGISIPGLGIVVLAIIWFGISELTAYISVFILATPLIVFNFWKGTQSIDYGLIEMAHSFDVSRLMIFREVLIPALVPYMLAAARFGLAISWKIIVLVELLALTDGVGYMINNRFQVYSIVGVIGWTLSFTLVMMIVEFGILKNIEKRVTKWRMDTDERRPTL